ncbi:hypothetical protein L6452_43680 [Arctium lappa]|uniref:Uncharacterized protein n=1 Tax=Arctium lappa TaxID=4217 RepID=A0ACB8XEB3_ARCLA|nr:hypothetical protein L6452_43680 [Arctium lappa]
MKIRDSASKNLRRCRYRKRHDLDTMRTLFRCSYCYDQKPPIYNPDNSSSYNSITCHSTTCMLVPMRYCSSLNNTCLYLIVYGDLSYSSGELATETITLGSSSSSDHGINSFAFTKVVFGCCHRNAGMFTNDQSDIIGLGGGPFSLVRR